MTGLRLSEAAQAAGYRLLAREETGSTNDDALSAADAGDPGKLWHVALRQTGGRGRRGRPWQTEGGNLAASLLIRPEVPTEQIATLGFVAGVALHRAMDGVLPAATIRTGIDGADLTGRGRVALKWPNDVLGDGAKLAGILLEARSRAGQGPAVVVGIGVNVTSAPTGTPYPATSIAALGGTADPAELFERLSAAWVDAYALWDGGRGLTDLLDEWRRSAAGIGSEIAVSDRGEIIRGVFETIDAEGRLLVRDSEGRMRTFAAGDVHFGTVASTQETGVPA